MKVTIEVSDRVKDRLVEEGYSPSYGARSLRRVITQVLEDALAEAMLSGTIQTGERAIVDLDETDTVTIHAAEKPERKLEMAR